MSKAYSTNWTKATTDISVAIAGLMSAIDAGRNAWIEIQKNGEQDFPINKVNPLLNNVENWTTSYGVPTPSNLEAHRFINETEKELTLNYTPMFGTPEAVENYYRTGKLTVDNFKGRGTCHAVKIDDAIELRKGMDGYNDYRYWTYFWKPKDGIPYWVVDNSIKEVYVVCTNDEPLDKKQALLKASLLFSQLAGQVN